MGDILKVDGERLLLAWVAHARAFYAALLHGNHQGADELVAALETEEFVLPVGLVEKDDVERKRVNFLHLPQLSKDITLVFALFCTDKLEKLGAQSINLLESGSELDADRDSLGKTARTTLVENE